jgi:ABC-2 type transport system ATP-binding protein
VTSEDSVVRIENLTVRYGGKAACEAVSFTVPRGSVYALLGRNGAGKSSLVRCALGQQKPQSGGVLLFGKPVWTHRMELMPNVGVVPEEPDAPPDMTAGQLAAFCSPLYSTWDREAFGARLHRFEIPGNRAFKNLSKGQKGMLLFALALAPHPDLLVLDDPTLGLDVVARKSTFEDLVEDLADRAPTVLITTHDLSGIEGIADRVGILDGGRLLLDTGMEELKLRYRKLRYRKEPPPGAARSFKELDAFDAYRVRETALGVEAVIAGYEEVAFARFQHTDGIRDAEVEPMSLEEIVVATTMRTEGDTL